MASPEKVDAFIKHIDSNGDGAIEKSELEAMRNVRAAAPPPEAPGDAQQDTN